MKFEKIYGGRGVAAPTPVRSIAHAKDDTESTFAQILQEMRDEKAADLQDRDSSEPDTIITRVYKGARLISETTTHGNRLTPSKALAAELTSYLPSPPPVPAQSMLASLAMQSMMGRPGFAGNTL